MTHHYFMLTGIGLDVCWDCAPVGQAVQAVLTYFGAATADRRLAASPIRFDYRHRGKRIVLPADARELSRYTPAVGFFEHDGVYYLRQGDAVAAIDPAAHAVRGWLPSSYHHDPHRLRTALCFFTWVGLSILLSYRRHYVLHAAALTRDERGYLFVGQRDSGKSTLAYSLVRLGWSYLSDDAVLLRAGCDQIEAVPMRKDFCLDPHAAAYFPEITHHWRRQLTDESKWQIDMEALHPGRARAGCSPRVLLFPKIVDRPESRLVEISRKEAMLGLIRESGLLVMLNDQVGPAHLRVLKRLLDQVHSYRLWLGRDLKERPDLVTTLLPAPGLDASVALQTQGAPEN